MNDHNDLDLLLDLIEDGEPVPMDLYYKMTDAGYDVDALIEVHAP